MASHTNAAMTVLPLSPEDTGLSILPVSHTFELMTNIVGALHCGGTLYINNSLRHLKKNLQKYQPTIIVCVPLVLQMMQKEILNTATMVVVRLSTRLSSLLLTVSANCLVQNMPMFSLTLVHRPTQLYC